MKRFFKRTALLIVILLVSFMLFSIKVNADESDGRFIMDAEKLSNNNIVVLFMKGASSSGNLYLGTYNPTNNDWEEIPVGTEAPVAKEAALAVYNDKAHVVYITTDNNMNYLYQTDTGWSEETLFVSRNANGSWVSTDALSCPDIVVDSTGIVHISYIDTDGAGDEDSKQADGMYATNASGSFVITAPVSCTGYREAYGMTYDSIVKPLKLSVGDNGRNLSYINYNYDGTSGSSGVFKTYDFQFLTTSNLGLRTNSSAKVFDALADGENYYTLVSQDNNYYILNGKTEIAETRKAFTKKAADMTLDGSNLYYAAINGTDLLFYQNGTFVEGKIATTGLSSSTNMVTLVIGGEQYILYTGSDDDRSLVISKLTSGGEIEEYLIPNGVKTWDELVAALNAGGTVKLAQDIAADYSYNTQCLTVPSEVTAVLDLNGHIIDRNAAWDEDFEYSRSVVISVDGDLTIIDSNPTATHTPEFTYTDPETSSTVVVNGGIITGGHGCGIGAICVNYGNVTMQAGTIVKNYTGPTYCAAAGVRVVYGNFTMTGGAIVGNYEPANDFGCAGVVVQDGTMTLSGNPVIKGNQLGTAISNVRLCNENNITINGALTSGANIGIYALDRDGKVERTITSGYNTNNSGVAPSTYFKSDDNNYVVTLKNNEAYLSKIHSVTVSNDGKGTGSANITSGIEGTEVTLSATPNDAEIYRFKEWQVISGGVTITDNKFTIGSSDVEVKAIFEKIPITSWAQLQTFLSKGEDVTLSQDIVAESTDSTLTIPRPVVIDLNGYIIDAHEYFAPVIRLSEYSNLRIDDSNPNREHSPAFTYKNPLNDEDVVVNGGIITGGKDGDWGNGIDVPRSTLTINAGSIIGNTTTRGDGAGVFLHSGSTCTMNGGLIAGNHTSGSGGGVYLYYSNTFYMKGGSIKHNSADGKGGGVYLWNNQSGSYETFDISGGSVEENKATSGAGGVHIADRGVLNVSGTAVIIGNKKGDENCNVWNAMNVNGQLRDGARIGITTLNYPWPGDYYEFTNGFSRYNDDDPANYFVSDYDKTAVVAKTMYDNRIEASITLEYSVTVSNDGNGTGTADITTGVQGTEVTLTATPTDPDIYRFKEWQVISGGVTVEDNKFTIKTSDVEVKAIFEKKPITSWAQLQTALNKGGEVTLTQDVIAGAQDTYLTIRNDTVLDLNGYVLDRNIDTPTIGGGAIWVNEGVNFVINDSRPNATHTPEITYKNQVTGEDVVVNGGIITGGTTDGGSGAIYYYWCTGTINGGTIVGNKSKGTDINGNAGGIVIRSSTVTMNGGAIVGNEALYGDGDIVAGGVCILDLQGSITEFNVNGGRITDNYTNSSDGSCVGGIYAQSGYLNVSGNVKICGNMKEGKDSNVILTNYRKSSAVHLTGALEDGAHIGVTTWRIPPYWYSAEDFTADYKTYNDGVDPSTYFSLDDEKAIMVYEGTEAKVALKYTITVTDDGNGTATVSKSEINWFEHPVITLTPNENYRFKEWQIISGDLMINENNEIELQNAQDVDHPVTDVQIKAIFEEIPEYTIAFDANGGTGEMNPVVQREGTTYTLPDCTFTAPEGKGFQKWKVRGPDTGFYKEKQAGETIDINQNYTISPKWLDVINVTLDPNGGTVSPTSLTYFKSRGLEYGALPIPTRDGYTFAGWQRKVNLVTTKIIDGNYLRISPSDTYYSGRSTDKPNSLFRDGDIISFDITVNNGKILGAEINDHDKISSYYTIYGNHNIKGYFVYNSNIMSENDWDFIDISINGSFSIDDVTINKFYVLSNIPNEGILTNMASDHVLIAKWNHDEHDYVLHSGTDYTCTENGSIDYYTCDCGTYFRKVNDTYEEIQPEDIVIYTPGHILEKVDRVEPTTTTTGNIDHYRCTKCGALFSDSEGLNPLTEEEVIIPKLYAEYDLWLGGIRVTTVNENDVLGDGKVTYNSSTNTLTLNGTTVNGIKISDLSYGIYYFGTEDFNIVANGTNVVNASECVNSTGLYVTNDSIKVNITANEDSSITIIGTNKALNKVPVLTDGVYAGGSTDSEGNNPEVYDSSKNDTYKWFKVPFETNHIVHFDTKDVVAIDDLTVKTGNKITKPADLDVDGYVFDGYYADENYTTLFDFDNTVVTSDLTIYVKLRKLISEVKFISKDIAVPTVNKNVTTDYDFTIQDIDDTLLNIGNKLWLKDMETYNGSQFVTGNFVLRLELNLTDTDNYAINSSTKLYINGIEYENDSNYGTISTLTYNSPRYVVDDTPTIDYQIQVINEGWHTKETYNGKSAMRDISGNLQQAMKIEIPDMPYEGSVEYRVHIENVGWQEWKKDGEVAGIEGTALRTEALQIRLTGEMADHYDVYYRTHVQNNGWMSWAKNGEASGSSGAGLRIEGIQIKLVKKGDPEPNIFEYPSDKSYPFHEQVNVIYMGHIENYGDVGTNYLIRNGITLGYPNQKLRVEGIKVISESTTPGTIEYTTHVEKVGWLDEVDGKWSKSGEFSGRKGKGLRVEGIKIRLTDELASKYSVYYRVKVEGQSGWQGWAKDGEEAGSMGYGKKLEAVQIKVLVHGDPNEGNYKPDPAPMLKPASIVQNS